MDHISHGDTHVLVLTDDEYAAIRLAVIRLAHRSMAEIEAEVSGGHSNLWSRWRTAQRLQLDWSGR